MKLMIKFPALLFCSLLLVLALIPLPVSFGASQEVIDLSLQPVVNTVSAASAVQFDPLKYTLGPDDVVEINVLRHPEFNGIYPVNLEGKIQYKFVGDVVVNGMTKKALEDKIKELIGTFVINPEVNVTILEYKSKVIYVLGEVGNPGKFIMRSETIAVREALVQAGLPTQAAAMRRCRLITPNAVGDPNTRTVDVYALLYKGDLRKNLDMSPGDVLYVPSTVMAKIIRVINPVTSTVGLASGGTNDMTTARQAMKAVK